MAVIPRSDAFNASRHAAEGDGIVYSEPFSTLDHVYDVFWRFASDSFNETRLGVRLAERFTAW